MSWQQYQASVRERPPRRLYQHALGSLAAGVAVDLGCGAGSEILDLLRRGWYVFAIDQEASAIQGVKDRVGAELAKNLRCSIQKIENITELPDSDFVFAYHSLPFCDVRAVEKIFERVQSVLRPGGLFAGSFFGPGDDWVLAKQAAGMTSEQLHEALGPYELEVFEEFKFKGPTALDGEKTWHYFEFIAKKPFSQIA